MASDIEIPYVHEGDGLDENPEGQEAQAMIMIDQAQMAGVWANFARVAHSEHEFTLDFVRLDYNSNPPQGLVVARVSVSPLFVTQLVDALQINWDMYAKKALPKEVQDAEDTDERS